MDSEVDEVGTFSFAVMGMRLVDMNVYQPFECYMFLYLHLLMSMQQHGALPVVHYSTGSDNQILPVFIANHPTYTPVLYDAWHSSVSHIHIETHDKK